ncbi:MAG: SAM-dependent chlorinase/fluorinase [Armatimonadetes bacterium]|nr:SAM-dependent chlorinase/fluorinase [Armatimonadota bacterium]
MTPIITLLTDFGLRDPFVGVMKGVVAGICPEARLVDLTHMVSPQDVEEGAYQLFRATRWFPAGTIHLAVVDPGVGSARRAVVVQGDRYLYVAPDNGLLTLALRGDPVRAVYEIVPGAYTLPRPSTTFHGRDIFAPVAAHLASGVSPQQMGPEVSGLTELQLPQNRGCEDRFETWVVSVDRYGNLITAAEPEALRFEPGRVEVGGRSIPLATHYAEVSEGSLLALWGSDGTLEISVRGGSAARVLEAGRRASVSIYPAGSA